MSTSPIDKGRRIPIYRQCADLLAEAIAGGRYRVGEFLPSERQLSEEFGVNRLTLRKGLAELAALGLIESLPGAGNRVIRTKAETRKTRTVGCVILRAIQTPALSPFFTDIFQGIERELSAARYEIFLSAVGAEELWDDAGRPRPNPRISPRELAGVLAVGGVSDELMLAYQKKGVPVVAVDRTIAARSISSVAPDNIAGAAEAGRYLLDLGHKHIAFLTAGDDPVCHARLDGLKKALAERGFSFDESQLIQGAYDIEGARAAMTEFLSRRKRKATAVFAINDEAAIGVMKAVQSAGLRIPDDMSVVGFDNIAWAEHAEPPLTTVEVQRAEMGRLAARTLVNQIESEGVPPSKISLETRLIVRNSCANPEH